MNNNLKKIYINDDGNSIFCTQFLDELLPKPVVSGALPVQKPRTFSLLIKEMVCKKYSKKHNATQWINRFEKEAIRMIIQSN